MAYVDGFVLAVPKANIEAYKEMAGTGGKVWMVHGALSYVECFGEDVPMGRPAQPEELAPSYVFLASNIDSSYISGEIIPVLGGQSIAG